MKKKYQIIIGELLNGCKWAEIWHNCLYLGILTTWRLDQMTKNSQIIKFSKKCIETKKCFHISAIFFFNNKSIFRKYLLDLRN